MNVTRIRHLENALRHFEASSSSSDISNLSIESHLRAYFRAHKSKVSATDRTWISDNFKDLYRWRGLVSHFTCPNPTTSDLLRTYLGNTTWRVYSESKSLSDYIRVSMPEALFAKLASSYGKQKAIAIGRIWNEKPSTFVRINPLLVDREDLIKKLSATGVRVEKTLSSDLGLRITKCDNISDITELKTNSIALQDESCQVVGSQVAVQAGQKVLDFCCGSGGKSLVFAPSLKGKGHLFLHDINRSFLIQARHKVRSAGIHNFTILSPKSDMLKNLKGRMDWVLVDVPSTGTGCYRRYPDRKWLYSDSLVEEKVQIQRQIFEEALKYLKKGGRIVYSTSSILPDENAEQVKYFCENMGLYLSMEPRYALPQSHGMDGYFCAVLEYQ
jgi:16S rRNA (cytosine967-C5)-methyltransferase